MAMALITTTIALAVEMANTIRIRVVGFYNDSKSGTSYYQNSSAERKYYSGSSGSKK
jgi:hypothetical protein